MNKVLERNLFNIFIIGALLAISHWAIPKLLSSQDFRCKQAFGSKYEFSLKETFSRSRTSCINKVTGELKKI